MWYEDISDTDRYNLRGCSRIIDDSLLELKSNNTTEQRKEKLYRTIEDCKDTINDIIYLNE